MLPASANDIVGDAVAISYRYHYGALHDGIESGDAVLITIDTPPHRSRHDGCETALFDMTPATWLRPPFEWSPSRGL
ncbi:DUF7350 domain-containing protein [Halostella limicola]